ncbi:unnamed protein product [Thlaspi arvense]|uniref:Nodulin-like domain-containing protein n=1 Tax=Thlaspi arvense TaxID=13288 RepID=A0AAU9S1V3_THLAR|nr:unnamed protein product [Thlaspi arvense]
MKPPKAVTTTTEEQILRKQPPSPPPQPPRVESMLQWWRRWTVLVAAIWIQAFTGTNFDFSAYSSDMKSSMGVSQSRLNYMAVASDLGKALGWSSGFAIAYFPVPAVLFAAAAMGLVGYGVQWLSIADVIDPPYSLVLVCCSLAGLSICWFNTVCFILCVRHFDSNHSLALSLVVSFNGISAALYTLGHEAIGGKSSASSDIYLLLNSLIPLIVSVLALWPVLTDPNSSEPHDTSRTRDETRIFIVFNALALITCFYLILPSSDTYLASSPRWHFLGAILLLLFPLCVPFLDYIHRALQSCFHHRSSGYAVVNIEEPKILKNVTFKLEEEYCDKLRLGDEHSLGMLVRRLEFWLYYIAYFCGGTIGLVYSNNLGQIAQSLGQSSSDSKSLVTLFSAFSFLGRLLSSAPDFTRKKLYYLRRTGWFAISLLPTPLAFFILAYSSKAYQTALLQLATALIGLSLGFVFAAAVSVTSDLFGRNSVGVNQNILITNIPIGSLFYGYMAGSVYDTNASLGTKSVVLDSVVCVGSNCYFVTFLFWGCLSVLGFVCSLFLFIRTRLVYHRLERNRI